MTRDLDRQVAEAMGWTKIRESNPNGVTIGVPLHDKLKEWVLPMFSTDYAALPEMLAWLQARAYEIEFHWNDTSKQWGGRVTRNLGQHLKVSATLPEALCNLIVAVAAKEKP